MTRCGLIRDHGNVTVHVTPEWFLIDDDDLFTDRLNGIYAGFTARRDRARDMAKAREALARQAEQLVA
jgi:hypothetical protein